MRMRNTQNTPCHRGILLAILGVACAGTWLHAQIPNPPATNAAPATPPLAATNGTTLSNYKHPTDPLRLLTRTDDPKSSSDRHFDWWPRNGADQNGTEDWVEYTFEKETAVSESRVYWFDDEPRGACRIPVSWRILFRQGNQWRPVEATSTYSVSKSKYDVIAFKPVTTVGLRLAVTFQTNWSAGVESWKVK